MADTAATPLSYSSQLEALIKGGQKIISLGLGEREDYTPAHVVNAAKKAIDNGYTRYSASQGLLELRDEICKKLDRDNQIKASGDNILVTPGVKNGLFISLMTILSDGDEVIVINPCYVSYLPILDYCHKKIAIQISHMTEDFKLNTDQLATMVNHKTKAILINYPNNPVGNLLNLEEVQFLHNLALKYPKLFLVSDEIYEKFCYTDNLHYSMAQFGDIYDQVITLNGFSKSYAMSGWRIGYVCAESELIKKMNLLNQHINTNTAAFTQMAGLAALSGSQSFINRYNKMLAKRRQMYIDFLNSQKVFYGPIPSAGFFAFMNITNTGLTSNDFARQLLEKTRVAVIPGNTFGDEYDAFVRISFTLDSEMFRRALDLIRQFGERL